jgi:hypothetical protein
MDPAAPAGEEPVSRSGSWPWPADRAAERPEDQPVPSEDRQPASRPDDLFAGVRPAAPEGEEPGAARPARPIAAPPIPVDAGEDLFGSPAPAPRETGSVPAAAARAGVAAGRAAVARAAVGHGRIAATGPLPALEAGGTGPSVFERPTAPAAPVPDRPAAGSSGRPEPDGAAPAPRSRHARPEADEPDPPGAQPPAMRARPVDTTGRHHHRSG